MYSGASDTRKLHIIEAILRTDDEGVLLKMEAIVDRIGTNSSRLKVKFSDLLGVLTAEDAEVMQKAINDNFEKVNPDDWK